MTQILRQSTQIKVVIGPVVAVGDGFTPVTTLALGTADEAEILKSDAASVTDISGATFAAITSADGYYNLTLSTSHTDTVGLLTVLINDDSLCLPVKATFQVVEEAIYDALFAASATGLLPANVTQVSGSATAADNAEIVFDTDFAANYNTTADKWKVDVTHVQGQLQTAADLAAIEAGVGDVLDSTTCWNGTADTGSSTTTIVDAALTQADTNYWRGQWVKMLTGNAAGQTALITAFTPGTDTLTFAPAMTQAVANGDNYIIIPAATVLADATYWLGTAIATPDTAGYPKVTIKSGTGTGEISLSAGVVGSVAEVDDFTVTAQTVIQTLAETALQTYHLDHLIASADPGSVVANSSFLAKLVSKSATPAFSSYDNTTDSLEAVRDNTGTAGAGLTNIGTIATVTNLTNLPAITSNWLTAAGLATDAVNEIVDQVWREAISDHSGTAGSTAEALNAAGAAGDPWTTALPGAYGAGSAGKIIGDNINATISSRASQTSVDTVDDFLDTEIAAIKAKTDNLPASFPTNFASMAITAAGGVTLGNVAHGGAAATITLESFSVSDGVSFGTVTFAGNWSVAGTTTLTGAVSATHASNDIRGAKLAATGMDAVTLPANLITATSIAADAITDAKVAADVTIASVTGAVGSVTGNVGGNVVGSVGSLAAQAKADVNAEVLDVVNVDTLIDGKTIKEAVIYIASACVGRVSGAGTGTEVFKGLDEATTRVTVTVDSSGNRTDVVYG